MEKIALNKKTIFSFLLFSALFFFLPASKPFVSAGAPQGGVTIGYDISQLSEQAKNLSDTFNKDYGLSSETKRVQSRRAVPAYNKQENETDKTSFFSLAPVYKKIFSSIIYVPEQTASVLSSILSPVGDFVSGLFVNDDVSEVVTDSYKVESSSSRKSRSSSSVSVVKVALATSSPSVIPVNTEIQISSSSESFTYNLPPKTYNLSPSVTRREVETLIKQSDDRNLTLIRSILTSPAFAKSSVVSTPALLSNSDSLSVQQSLDILSRRISVIQENNIRQLDKPTSIVTRSDSDISSLTNVTISNPTVTGLLTGTSGTFSSTLSVSGDSNFDSGTLYIDSTNNRVGIASSSPSETLSINGATYFSQISAPSVTTDRLYNSSGDLYWNGTVIGSASVGNWTSSGGNVYRASGNVGIGTTSPGTTLSVSGVGNFAGTGSTLYSTLTAPYFTATSTNASTFPYASSTSLTVSGSTYLTNLGQGWLHTNGGTNAITSSTSPTVAYLNATSTTATSTFAGGLDLTNSTGMGLNFGSNTLFYQNNQRFLTSSTTSAGNLTIGYQSATGLDSNGGLYNTGVGYQALGNATSTDYNTALGYQALKGSATISNVGRNTAVGYQSLYLNTTGYQNTAYGAYSLQVNTTGYSNTSIGYNSLSANTTGIYNMAIGAYSLLNSTTGNYNMAIGANSLRNNTTGTGNVGIGTETGYSGTTKDQNSVIDNYATFIGYQASRSEAVASTSALTNITAIGKNARVGASNSIVLGGTGADAVNVGIGTTSPYARLSVVGETVAEKFTATSTTATSTFNGDINFGTTSNILQGGQRFLTSSTTSAGNLTIGYQSATGLDSNGGLYNTGLGYQALGNATSTDYNTALGYQALKGSATISGIYNSNTAVGYQALLNNSTGYYNTANGLQSLVSNTTGHSNTANGWRSLYTNTTGSSNVANGLQSLYSNLSGGYNTAIGGYALYNNNYYYNTAVGYQSFYNNTTGAGNVGFGYNTGRGDGTADQRSVIDNYATFIGYQASRSEAVASTSALTNITAIGKNARVGASNSIVLGGTGADAVNVGIGTTSPWRTLSVTGSMAVTGLTAGAAGDYAVCINNTTKEITNAGATGCVVSSKRFKENISALDSGLDELMQLKPSKFTYIGQTGEHIGLIAEDVNEVDKRLVEYEADGITPRTVRYLELSALLIKSIQDLNIKIDNLSESSTTLSKATADAGSDRLFSWIVGKFASTFGIVFEKDTIKAKNADVEKLCIGNTCVTEDQLKDMLGSSQSSSSSSPVSSSSSSEPSSSSSVNSSVSSAESSSNSSSSSESTSSSSSSGEATSLTSASLESSSSSSEIISSSSSQALPETSAEEAVSSESDSLQ